MNWFFISIFTALLWGSATVLAKIGTVRLSPRKMLLTFGVTAFIYYYILWRFLGTPFPAGNYTIPLISEGSAAIAFIFYYRSLELAPASLVAPITSAGIIISVLIGMIVFDNPVSGIQMVSVFAIVFGIILLTIKEFRFNKGRWVIYALLAMIGWGIWGGLSGKAVSIVKPININLFFAGMALIFWIPYYLITGINQKQKNSRKVDHRDFLFGVGSAVFSCSGSALFYIAVNLSYVSLAIPVSNLHPMVSVIFDTINGKPPKVHQWAGIIMILAGLFFIRGG